MIVIRGFLAAVLLIAALPAYDAINAMLAERFARRNCTDAQVFTVLNRVALRDRLAARRLPANRGKLLIETERPAWQWNSYGGMLAEAEYRAYWHGRPLLEIHDIAVAPKNIFTRAGVVQRYISYQCLPTLTSDVRQLMFAY